MERFPYLEVIFDFQNIRLQQFFMQSELYTIPVQFLTQSVESQTDACPSPRGGENCEDCLQPDLDLSTGCTTCVETRPIECTPGEQGCGVRTIDLVKGVGADSQIYHLSGLLELRSLH